MQHPRGECGVLKREIGCTSLTWECCLPPSCGFPPKSFPLKRGPTISGDTFGTRAQGRPRTAPPRRRHVMPLAMRPLREESCALPAHVSSALGTHTVAAALKRASPCERLVSGSTKECSACASTLYQAARQHALKQERIETNGDGVKPGSPPAGLGGANVQLGRERPRMNIFTPSPFVSEFRPRLFRNSVPVCFGIPSPFVSEFRPRLFQCVPHKEGGSKKEKVREFEK